jgi:hypothetical protein
MFRGIDLKNAFEENCLKLDFALKIAADSDLTDLTHSILGFLSLCPNKSLLHQRQTAYHHL